jgi:uncharacterized protein YcbK (DUF882 family)
MTDPSPHLSWWELACHDPARTPYPTEWRLTRAVEVAELFEEFRRWCGDQPLIVLSAYRTPAWNAHIGGARHSQHVQGRALDLKRPRWTVDRLHREARAFAAAHPNLVGGLGYYPTFVHLDTRPSRRLVVWGGSRAHADRGIS